MPRRRLPPEDPVGRGVGRGIRRRGAKEKERGRDGKQRDKAGTGGAHQRTEQSSNSMYLSGMSNSHDFGDQTIDKNIIVNGSRASQNPFKVLVCSVRRYI